MELTLARIVSGLQERIKQHTVVCLKEEPAIANLFPPSVDIHCMRARPNDLRLPFRLASLFRKLAPTVIHARNWGTWPDTVFGNLVSMLRTPVILSFHGLGRANYMPLRRRLASYGCARLSSALMTVSDQSKELMVSKWGWPLERIVVIPNGVDTSRFTPDDMHVSNRTTIVGTVGNLRPVKNQALLVRACSELSSRGIDLELRIAGEGPEQENLYALARSLGFGSRLHLAGRVQDVPGFLRELDIFVLSSDSEQHPNALTEAMACGLPCVATQVGCVEELLDHGNCGVIISPSDTATLCDALSTLVADRALRGRLSDAARRRVCEHYDLTRVLDAYEKLYTSVSFRRVTC